MLLHRKSSKDIKYVSCNNHVLSFFPQVSWQTIEDHNLIIFHKTPSSINVSATNPYVLQKLINFYEHYNFNYWPNIFSVLALFSLKKPLRLHDKQIFNVFSTEMDENCVYLISMLFLMFRLQSFAIACSEWKSKLFSGLFNKGVF